MMLRPSGWDVSIDNRVYVVYEVSVFMVWLSCSLPACTTRYDAVRTEYYFVLIISHKKDRGCNNYWRALIIMVSIRDGPWIMIMTVLWRVLIICVTDQHAISNNPSADAAALSYLQGNENYRNGQMSLAIESYAEAVRIDPGLKHAWSNLGHVYLSEGQSVCDS